MLRCQVSVILLPFPPNLWRLGGIPVSRNGIWDLEDLGPNDLCSIVYSGFVHSC